MLDVNIDVGDVFECLKNTIKDGLISKIPFEVTIGVFGNPQTVKIDIINKYNECLNINNVRIHYGCHEYSWFIQLYNRINGECKLTLKPNETQMFIIPIPPIVIGRMVVADTDKYLENKKSYETAYPSVPTPYHLMRAIKNGNEKDSWIEVDFNELKRKKFKQKEIHTLFQSLDLTDEKIKEILEWNYKKMIQHILTPLS